MLPLYDGEAYFAYYGLFTEEVAGLTGVNMADIIGAVHSGASLGEHLVSNCVP